MYSQIFVPARRYHSPGSLEADRSTTTIVPAHTCATARRAVALLFFSQSFVSSSRGWNSFRGRTPSSTARQRRSIASIILLPYSSRASDHPPPAAPPFFFHEPPILLSGTSRPREPTPRSTRLTPQAILLLLHRWSENSRRISRSKCRCPRNPGSTLTFVAELISFLR